VTVAFTTAADYPSSNSFKFCNFISQLKTIEIMLIKNLTVCLLSVVLMGKACSKDDPSSVKPAANWVLAGQNYSSLTYSGASGNVHFTNGPTQGVWGRFNALPNGSVTTYKIIKGPASALANDEMVLQVDNGVNESWYSTGVGNKLGTVSKDYYGNLKVTVPAITVKHFTNGVMQNDSTTASADLNYLKQ
jgi:hypothetical protein